MAPQMVWSQIKLLVSWSPVQVCTEQSEFRRSFTMDLEPNSESQTASTIDRGSPLIPDSQGSPMDWKSHPVLSPIHRPTSSVYSDDMSIMTYLIHKVSEETRAQEYETIASFMRENQALEEELARHQKAWNGTIMLANEVIQAITTFRKSLTTVDTKVAGVEKDWLAFWGIYKESLGSHPPWV